MTGGLQVQAVETCKALNSLGGGIEAELFDWSKAEKPCDLYHFVSFPPHLYRIAELVRESGRLYVITMLCGGPRDGAGLRISAARRWIRSKLPGSGGRERAMAGAAAVVTITEADVTAAHVVFGIDRKKISVVPNGVPEAFFNCTPTAWRDAYGKGDFVLCVGAIQPRKNQLLLAQVCNHLKFPLVLLGPILPGEAEDARRVAEAMRQNEALGGLWLKDLRNEDALLLAAHAACRVFALLSAMETQPLSVMQAMAARKPILLLAAPYTEDKLFRRLSQAPSAALEIVAGALKRVWETGEATELSPDYTWAGAARRLQIIYEHALKSR